MTSVKSTVELDITDTITVQELICLLTPLTGDAVIKLNQNVIKLNQNGYDPMCTRCHIDEQFRQRDKYYENHPGFEKPNGYSYGPYTDNGYRCIKHA